MRARNWLVIFAICLFSTNVFCYELILVRHFEKVAEVDNPGLTEAGHIRAENLAIMLDSFAISKIYSTDYNRTIQTALPVSTQKQLAINYYDPGNLKNFANNLLSRQDNALIVGHSNTTPALINLLGGEAKNIAETDYGEVFIIRIEAGEISQSSQFIPSHK